MSEDAPAPQLDEDRILSAIRERGPAEVSRGRSNLVRARAVGIAAIVALAAAVALVWYTQAGRDNGAIAAPEQVRPEIQSLQPLGAEETRVATAQT